MRATLYSLTLSHPAQAVRMALERKGIEHRVIDLLPGLHPVMLRAAGFRGGTVPALRIDGRRVQHSVGSMKLLEELKPEPPLYPSDPAKRRAVEEAEEWGERELQEIPRRAFRWSLLRNPELRVWLARETGIPAPRLAALMNKPLAVYFARKSGADDAVVRSDMSRLPGLIEHVDQLIAQGVIGAPEPNAADLQIATTLRVLLANEDLRSVVEGRPAEDLARRLVPDHAGPIPSSLPREWLPTTRGVATRPRPDPARPA